MKRPHRIIASMLFTLVFCTMSFAQTAETPRAWLDRLPKVDRANLAAGLGAAPTAMPDKLRWFGTDPMMLRRIDIPFNDPHPTFQRRVSLP